MKKRKMEREKKGEKKRKNKEEEEEKEEVFRDTSVDLAKATDYDGVNGFP